MEKTMTNVKALEVVLTSGYDFPADVVEKLEKIKASFEKKSTNRKPTDRQKENEVLKAAIFEALDTEQGKTASEVLAVVNVDGTLPIQRVTALLTQMYNKGEGTIDRYMEKKKTYFKRK